MCTGSVIHTSHVVLWFRTWCNFAVQISNYLDSYPLTVWAFLCWTNVRPHPHLGIPIAKEVFRGGGQLPMCPIRLVPEQLFFPD